MYLLTAVSTIYSRSRRSLSPRLLMYPRFVSRYPYVVHTQLDQCEGRIGQLYLTTYSLFCFGVETSPPPYIQNGRFTPIYHIFHTRELSRLKIKISSAPTLTS